MIFVNIKTKIKRSREDSEDDNTKLLKWLNAKHAIKHIIVI